MQYVSNDFRCKVSLSFRVPSCFLSFFLLFLFIVLVAQDPLSFRRYQDNFHNHGRIRGLVNSHSLTLEHNLAFRMLGFKFQQSMSSLILDSTRIIKFL